MSETKYYQREAQGTPVVEAEYRAINARVWTGFDNGASLVNSWNGERDVALLGYIPLTNHPVQYADESGIRMARFKANRNLKVTASGICSPVSMYASANVTPYTDLGYFEDTSIWRDVIDLQNDFSAAGGIVGQSTAKPSKLQLLVGVWFDHDNSYLNPITDPTNTTRRGVSRGGIGAGDLVYLENLTTGGTTWYYAWHNELITTGGELPKSTNWAGLTDIDGFAIERKHRVTWLQMLTEKNDEWRISVRHPGWGRNPVVAPSFYYPPVDVRYYVAVYIIEGCGLLRLVNGQLSIGAAGRNASKVDRSRESESAGVIMSDGYTIL